MSEEEDEDDDLNRTLVESDEDSDEGILDIEKYKNKTSNNYMSALSLEDSESGRSSPTSLLNSSARSKVKLKILFFE